MARDLLIVHFNDVYNIEPSEREPVGGAARACTKVKEFSNPLVLFSGDAFSPSLMSTVTRGSQMPPVLNALGVHTACVGNHDFDYGLDTFEKRIGECSFPWLMANVLDRNTGEPLLGLGKTRLFEWQGVKVGVAGLVEREWLETLSTVDEQTVEYLDFVAEGRRLAGELRAQGAELVIALTHMREPNDRLLAQSAPEFDLVLGGHDHMYLVEEVQPHGVLLVKSGTDFKDLTSVLATLPNGGGRPQFTWQRHAITSDIAQDPAVGAIVEEHYGAMQARMDEVIGETLTPLDGRFSMVRTGETNLGNLVCDVWRAHVKADVALINSGTLRSDQIHPAGTLKMKDLVSILPYLDETCVIEAEGSRLLQALENGVSQVPRMEGRFPQVSGIKFKYDSNKPPGERVIRDSVIVADNPLQEDRLYRVAIKQYMSEGKDGYDCFVGCNVIWDPENAPILPNLVRYHFATMRVLNDMTRSHRNLRRAAEVWRNAARSKLAYKVNKCDTVHYNPTQSYTCIKDPGTQRYMAAPVLEGRIVNVSAPKPPEHIAV